MLKILITGCAGFIGSNMSKSLLQENYEVIGVDNLNEYYDLNLKLSRLSKIQDSENFIFIKGDISDYNFVLNLFEKYEFDIVINLAAQAGVRYSIENPDTYIESNVIGFYNILQAARKYPVKHLLYASSSSIYGANKKIPFEESDKVDTPVSLYAATKKTNELFAYTYSHLYKIPTTGLRFFTVYGPEGRPDMAYFKFTDMFFDDKEIHIYNDGDYDDDLYRDFTYIDDVVEGIKKLMLLPPDSNNSDPYRIVNVGNNKPEKLMFFINTLEECLGLSLGRNIEFKKKFEPLKPGDVKATYASTDLLQNITNFKPETPVKIGLQKFTDWYVEYFDKE